MCGSTKVNRVRPAGVLNRAAQLFGGGAGRHQDERVGGAKRIEASRAFDQPRSKAGQVRRIATAGCGAA